MPSEPFSHHVRARKVSVVNGVMKHFGHTPLASSKNTSGVERPLCSITTLEAIGSAKSYAFSARNGQTTVAPRVQLLQSQRSLNMAVHAVNLNPAPLT